MQKFTRALTREIEVAGERLAVTFSQEGMSLRPVGSRRPPHTMSWDALVCGCVQAHGAEQACTAEQVSEAVKTLKAGGERAPKSRRTADKEQQEAPASNEPPADTTSAPAPPARDHAAGASLPILLSRLDHWLGEHRARYKHGLRPGASSTDLDNLQATVGRPVPQDLRTWLGWHNGQDPEVFGALEEDWHPMSTGEIAEAKKELDADSHNGWHKEWIPFLDDDNGNFLVLDPTQASTPVRECWRGKAEHAVVAASLAAWVEQFVRGLEQGVYKEDPERGGLHRS
jgi:cell wall assembly regulator SMI1